MSTSETLTQYLKKLNRPLKTERYIAVPFDFSRELESYIIELAAESYRNVHHDDIVEGIDWTTTYFEFASTLAHIVDKGNTKTKMLTVHGTVDGWYDEPEFIRMSVNEQALHAYILLWADHSQRTMILGCILAHMMQTGMMLDELITEDQQPLLFSLIAAGLMAHAFMVYVGGDEFDTDDGFIVYTRVFQKRYSVSDR